MTILFYSPGSHSCFSTHRRRMVLRMMTKAPHIQKRGLHMRPLLCRIPGGQNCRQHCQVDSIAASLFVLNWLSRHIVSDDKIQITILILRQGALSNFVRTTITTHAPTLCQNYVLGYEQDFCHDINQPTPPTPHHPSHFILELCIRLCN